MKNITIEYMDFQESRIKLALYSSTFYYPGGEFDIHNCIKVQSERKGSVYVDDDFMKKVETDTLTKALSKLGFSCDVFMGRYDDNKYVNEIRSEFTEYRTYSKQTELDRKAYWKEFKFICEDSSVDPMDFMSHLVEDTTDKKKVCNTVVTFLKNKTLFQQQIENYIFSQTAKDQEDHIRGFIN